MVSVMNQLTCGPTTPGGPGGPTLPWKPCKRRTQSTDNPQNIKQSVQMHHDASDASLQNNSTYYHRHSN